jgi:hypothetical protein
MTDPLVKPTDVLVKVGNAMFAVAQTVLAGIPTEETAALLEASGRTATTTVPIGNGLEIYAEVTVRAATPNTTLRN